MLWMNLLNMAVLLSANLGVMNLLPFPALDGGRLVFLVIEAIRRKPVNRRIEGTIHFAGLMLLMVLWVVVKYNDIVMDILSWMQSGLKISDGIRQGFCILCKEREQW